MAKHKKARSHNKPWRLIVFGLFGLGFLITLLLQGTDIALLNSKGLIAQQERNLMIFSVTLLLTIAAPALIILYSFAWQYRESNAKAAYDPHVRSGKLFIFSIWAIPSVFMLLLASVMWPATHKLQPLKPVAANTKPVTIQVIAMRWKWLFIYPEQNIATVNFVQVPVNTPVQFVITADDAPMSSFWIPHLSGQLYAMTGHVNRLNLMAEEPGDYPGRSAEINGAGFSEMKFIARATSSNDFNSWVQSVKHSKDVLDPTAYKKLLEPSESNPATFYSMFETGLYDKVVMKYEGPAEGHRHHE